MDSGNSKKPTMASIKTRPLERNIALTKLGLGAGTKIVAHSLFNIFRGEVARGGGAGLAQSDHQHLAPLPGVRHQRTFSVDRPTSTRIRVTIQKRTMIFGSGQPFSS
mgnify:CR=1 FL=1